MNKKIKLLLSILGCAFFVLPIFSISSCNSNTFMFDTTFILDCLTNESEPTNLSEDDYIDFLAKKTQEELYCEVAYDLFGVVNDNRFTQANDKSLLDLFNDGIINMSSNITKYSAEILDSKLHVSFLGYLQCFFVKDYETEYMTNDYIMFVYNFDDIVVDINADSDGNISLVYEPIQPDWNNNMVLGVIDVVKNGKASCFSIPSIDTTKYLEFGHYSNYYNCNKSESKK